MVELLRGRQTQFYIDILYGIAFALGFVYLLAFGMDARVAAFQGGLVLGYFLRVWENMSIYERILAEEVAKEAEEAVSDEVEAQVPGEAEDAVADEIEAQVPGEAEDAVADELKEQVPSEAEAAVADELEEQVPSEAEEAVADELEEQITDEIGERISAEAQEQLADDAVTELLDRFEEVDEELATRLREQLDEQHRA